ncbi:MAG: PKD domain-containing protein [Bacteroidota bacterium]
MRSILVSLLSLFLFLQTGNLSAQFTATIVADGATEVCLGIPVKAHIWCSSGKAPYDVVINNREGEYEVLENIGTLYTIYLEPVSDDTFYIASAVDDNGVSGITSGEIAVTIRESTPVSFDLDRSAFLYTEPGYTLKSSPAGATFFGPGIANGRFYPEIASYEDSPHTISCTLTNSFGCESTDETDLYVLLGEPNIHMVSGDDTLSTICDKSIGYTLKGSNGDHIPGRFELYDMAGLAPISGYITDDDLSDDEAVLNPDGLAGSYEVVYTYGVNEFELSAALAIELSELGTVGISGLPSKVCQSDEPYLLLPEPGIEDPSPVYVFSGPGVVGTQDEGFYFDPGSPDAAEGKNTIELDYTSSLGCNASAAKEVTVQFAPGLSFSISPVCLPAHGGLVSFENTSSGKYAVNGWNWDYGDPDSGDDNSSDQEHGEHFYTEPGNWTITLTASTDNGCIAVLQTDTVLADQPEADFTLINDCFLKGVKTSFLDRSTSALADINELTWTFKTRTGGVLGIMKSESPADTIEYDFRSMGEYQVHLQIVNEVGCAGEINRSFELKPIKNLSYAGYYENFNGEAEGWKVNSNNEMHSWVRDEPDFSGFQAQTGDLAWYTNLPEMTGYLEHSWVQSPCFDLSGLSTPVVQMDLMKSFVPDVDGAVLQYQEMVSDGWTTIGSVGEGLNWYNHEDIENKPGGSNQGWGLSQFAPDSEWVNAGYSVENLAGKPFIKLRVAIGTGGRQEFGNQGFAFDNFFIGQRIRGSVLEYFTNASSAAAGDANDVMEAFVREHSGIVYDIQYHMEYPGADPMNANNPYPPATRAFNNGVQSVPYAILNGGVGEENRYDFSDPSQEPDSEILLAASLEVPLFNIKLEVNYGEDSLRGSARVICAADNFSNNLQLFLAVIEREQTAYSGLVRDTFRNVVLDMLPSPTGKLLGNEWSRGTVDTVEFEWEYAGYVEDIEDLSVVAFVQDRNSGKVLQAAAIPHTPGVGIFPKRSEEGPMHLYPNPARDHLNINFGDEPEADGEMKVVDLSGRMVFQLEIQAGQQIQVLDISKLPDGMYMVYRMKSGLIKGYSKFVKSR